MTAPRPRERDELIPPALRAKISAYHAAGADWLRELPALIARCAAQWDLTLLPAFEPGGDASWTAPVRRNANGGQLAVLKISVPTPEPHDHSAASAALRAWGGRGAVELFAHDVAMRASLLECCVPGSDAIALAPGEADEVAAEVLTQLWAAGVPASPGVRPLADVGAERASLMEARAERFGGGVDVGPFREAARLYASLPASAARRVLLHGDFHPRNVLRSERGWLAIDPLPRLGDPSFDVATFLKDEAANVARVDALTDRLGLERQRTRAWLFALTVQAAAWHLAGGDQTSHDAYRRAASVLW